MNLMTQSILNNEATAMLRRALGRSDFQGRISPVELATRWGSIALAAANDLSGRTPPALDVTFEMIVDTIRELRAYHLEQARREGLA